VIRGGNFDVDAKVTSPDNQTVYYAKRKKTGMFEWNAYVGGAYRLCFNNLFSTITHKIVSFDFHIVHDFTFDREAHTALDAPISYVRTASFCCVLCHFHVNICMHMGQKN